MSKTQIVFTLLTLLAAIIGIAVTYFSPASNARRQRRREFRNDMACLLDQFRAALATDLIKLHQESIPSVREKCTRIGEDIRRGWRKEFDDACVTYCALTAQQIENPNPKHAAKYMFTNERPEGKLFDWELGRARICDCLKRLIRSASSWPF